MSNTQQSILIVKTSAIGDVIQTFPVLEYLRRKFPDARIDWVVEEGIAPLLRSHPLIDYVIEIKSKAWRKTPFQSETRKEFCAFSKVLRSISYDLLFDMKGNAKSAVVTGCARAKSKIGFGWKSVREKSNLLVTTHRLNPPSDLPIRAKYLHLVQRFFGDLETFEAQGVKLKLSEAEQARLNGLRLSREKARFMVCFGSKWPNKRMDRDTLTSFLEKIAADCDPSYFFIFGDEEEKRLAENLSLHFQNSVSLGDLSLPLWQALMWEMDGVIAVDSAALHLCGTTQTPSFSVFGPSLASCYKPPEERHLAVQGTCPYGKTFLSRCPILRTCSTGACIRNLQVDTLFAAYKSWSERFSVLLK